MCYNITERMRKNVEKPWNTLGDELKIVTSCDWWWVHCNKFAPTHPCCGYYKGVSFPTTIGPSLQLGLLIFGTGPLRKPSPSALARWPVATTSAPTTQRTRAIARQAPEKHAVLGVNLVLLMAEIPNNHLGCIKPWTNGINYLSTGAGFLPSAVGGEFGA